MQAYLSGFLFLTVKQIHLWILSLYKNRITFYEISFLNLYGDYFSKVIIKLP